MFGPRFKLFRLVGFDIYVDLSWFLIAILITWSLATRFGLAFPELAGKPAAPWIMGLAGMAMFFFSIVLHELAHALAARQFGVQMRGITLFIFGGVAEMSDEPPTPKAEFWVAIAGPIMSVILGVLFLAASFIEQPLTSQAVLRYLGVINFFLVAFNMVPAFPLDGGRVLRSVLWAVGGNLRRATRVTSTIGSIFGYVLIALGVLWAIVLRDPFGGLWLVLVGMFLRQAAQMSYQQLLLRRALQGEKVERFMKTNLITVHPETTVAELVDQFVYRHHHKLYPVTDNGHVLGCVTTRQIKDLPQEEWPRRTVGELADKCSPQNTVTPGTDAIEALSKMSRLGVSRLLVVDHDRLAGILTLKDLMRFMSMKVELEP